MGFAIGINPTNPSATAQTDGNGFSPGDVIQDYAGNTWVYVKASAAIAQYDVVTYDETFITTVAPVSTSNDARGDKLGVAAAAFEADDYGFLQIYGPCTVNVLASCNANAELTITATGGSLDDATTASLMVADGIVLTAANSASVAAAKAGILNWPVVGRTLT
jgi:hypothetical protein